MATEVQRQANYQQPKEKLSKPRLRDIIKEKNIAVTQITRDFIHQQIQLYPEGLDFSGARFIADFDVENIDFSHCILFDVEFLNQTKLPKSFAGATLDRLTVERLLKRGYKNFVGVIFSGDFSDLDFSGCDLSHASFGSAVLKNTNFKDAIISANTSFDRAILNKQTLISLDHEKNAQRRKLKNVCLVDDLSGCDFSDYELKNVIFQNNLKALGSKPFVGCKVDEKTLASIMRNGDRNNDISDILLAVDGSLADFSKINLGEAEFKQFYLSQKVFLWLYKKPVRNIPEKINMTYWEVDKKTFEALRAQNITNFCGVNFINDMSGVSLAECFLDESAFLSLRENGVKDFSGVVFHGDISQLNFSGLILKDIRISTEVIIGKNFFKLLRAQGEKHFSGLSFTGDFSGVDFSGCALSGAKFKKVNLQDADFENVSDRRKRDFKIYFEDAILANTDLGDISFEKIELGNKCRLDKATKVGGVSSSYTAALGETAEQSLRNLLIGYAGKSDMSFGRSFFSLFSGHWNRSHCKEVSAVLRDKKITTAEGLLGELVKNLENSKNKKINPEGSLARRVRFIAKVYNLDLPKSFEEKSKQSVMAIERSNLRTT